MNSITDLSETIRKFIARYLITGDEEYLYEKLKENKINSLETKKRKLIEENILVLDNKNMYQINPQIL